MKYINYAVMTVISVVMLTGAALKLGGNDVALGAFDSLGLPGWFGPFIGVSEALGAIGLWLRPTSRLAAMGISIIMVGALYYHAMFPPLEAGIPAAVVLLFCLYIIGRRGTGVIG